MALPDSLDTIGQFNEKARLAYRPMALAEWLLSERARNRLADAAPGFYVVNTAPLPYTGWVTVPVAGHARRRSGVDHYESGLQPWSRPKSPADLSPENDAAVFCRQRARNGLPSSGCEDLAPNSVGLLKGQAAGAGDARGREGFLGLACLGALEGHGAAVVHGGLGDFLSVRPVGFAPRWILADMADGKAGPGGRDGRPPRVKFKSPRPDTRWCTSRRLCTRV